jgi:coenzyme Q-binding protein COQ10
MHSCNIKVVFDVVRDVGRYGEFVPFCVGCRVLPDDENVSPNPNNCFDSTEFRAEMTGGFMKLTDSYVSLVKATPYSLIEAEAIDSDLFRHLKTVWKFEEISESECMVEFDVEFEFKSHIYAYIANIFFIELAKRTMSSFEERCLAIASGVR